MGKGHTVLAPCAQLKVVSTELQLFIADVLVLLLSPIPLAHEAEMALNSLQRALLSCQQ